MSRGLSERQRQILAILAQGLDRQFVGFEKSHLKALVGGDKANTRRAIRGLLNRRPQLIVEWEEEDRNVFYAPTMWGAFHARVPDPKSAPQIRPTVIINTRVYPGWQQRRIPI